ncbi:Glyoxalase/bleomycin resistance protein/dioxygenase [Acrodontium crateriforme]|uniref:Glyoxalase/bleomycin resistance protein/dioxygenase n=1 Tax=Acrodontium crateriforme TaxID=150365 RepID=A0AAQ3MA98_9PEZI|nr:Glyoxalase/bleomycin resistance protein/dioxygenase [Acrodontium crateriforme]
MAPIQSISAITLFVEDLAASKAFYTSVFNVPVIFEDESSTALKFDNIIVNLLKSGEAQTLVKPRTVGSSDAGKRFQLSIWVKDLDQVCEYLNSLGVGLLSGPQTQPWGMRTITFEDPAGTNWEVAQQIEG